MTHKLEIRQEYIDNQETDVEVEDLSSPHQHDPWDPDQIRIHTKTYSLRQIVDMIDDKDIDLAPDFQRQYVWKQPQRQGLIESLLLGIPLPSFYFNENRKGLLQVVDGVQRLTTIHSFYKDGFKLDKLDYLSSLEGQSYTELDAPYRRRLQNTQLVAHVIEPQTPIRVKFDVFKRINTGGTPLSAQEIRHCMSQPRSRDLLKTLVELPEFTLAMGKKLAKNPRMADREIALRLIAFHIIPVENYSKYESLDLFLSEVTHLIDVQLADEQIAELTQKAKTALTNAHTIFDKHAFRKWPQGVELRNPINRALVESWGTALASYEPARIAPHTELLQSRARELMTSDSAFIDSISVGTGDSRKVHTRMSRVTELLDEVLS